MITQQLLEVVPSVSHVCARRLSYTQNLHWIHRLTRMRVVDNSALGKRAMLAGKPPYVINVYKPGEMMSKGRRGALGDKILVAVLGELKRAYIVGQKMHKSQLRPLVPRTDTNNIILLDDDGNPLGTRILVPIPGCLRSKGGDFSKVLAIATRFV